MLAAIAGQVVWTSEFVPGLAIVEVPQGRVDLGLAILNADDTVDFVERDPLGGPCGPGDPWYQYQWGPSAMCAPEAWSVRAKSTKLIAVLDSGVNYNLPDLNPNIWVNANEHGHDEDGSGIVGDYRGASFVIQPYNTGPYSHISPMELVFINLQLGSVPGDRLISAQFRSNPVGGLDRPVSITAGPFSPNAGDIYLPLLSQEPLTIRVVPPPGAPAVIAVSLLITRSRRRRAL